MRRHRRLALGAAVLAAALTAAACSSGGGSASGGSSSPSGSGATLASTFVFGAPPDCATNKFCALGLKSTYGIVFKEVKSLDFGGPETVAALKSGAVQVGELFSTSVYDPDFQVLVDDKHLEAADNITPVIRAAVDIDHQDPADVAKTFLNEQGLLSSSTTTGNGKTITVGVSGDFSESKIIAEMYAQVLENAGYTVKRQLSLQDRKASDTALFSGQIDVKPEYLASEAGAQDPNAAVSGDTQNNLQVLTGLLKPKNVNALTPSAAIDTNVFVVMKETASKYKLVNLSDLAKPAS
jgi:glycine betaine/choline ABC-type transport system substrate-binding protein